MIIELICTPFVLMAKGLISLIPVLGLGVNSVTAVMNLILTGLNFFPVELWVMVIGSIVFWITLNISFNIGRFVLDLFTAGLLG